LAVPAILRFDETSIRIEHARMEDQIFTIQVAYPRVWHACHRRHRRGATDHKQTSARDAAILAHLDPRAAISAGKLAKHLGIAPSTLSEAVEELERHGYVVRAKSERDRRIVLLVLTKKGRDAVAAESALDAKLLRNVLGRLSASDRDTAVAGLAILGNAAVSAQAARGRRS
jgi:DNA-binding MarR family transcriptional regulator